MFIETLPTLKYCAVVLISVGLNKAAKYLTFRFQDLVTDKGIQGHFKKEHSMANMFSAADGLKHSQSITVMLYSLSQVGKQETK